MSLRRLVFTLCGVFAISTLACGGGEAPAPTKAASSPAAAASKKKKAGKEEAKEEEQRSAPVGPPIDFNDSSAMRDPFLSYAREFAEEAKKRVRSQRDVVLDQYGLDELKLAGLVTGIRPARAMLID